MNTPESTKPSMRSRGAIGRKTLRMSQEEMVKFSEMEGVGQLPALARPAIPGVELAAWAEANREALDALLLRHRAILFRGFDINSAELFDGFIRATSNGQLLEYVDRSSPRHEVGDKIYTSTDYPSDQKIFLHNEGTYWLSWPLKIYFSCQVAPAQGGETPIGDCRRVYQRIDRTIRDRFADKGVLYMRNYNDGFGLRWQEVFQTEERARVEEHCRRNRIEYEWKGGERLRTRQVRPAVAQHPRTGEAVWFNHAAFFHVSTLEEEVRSLLLEEFREEDLPHNTYYGDGTPIEPSVLDELRGAYLQEKVCFRWEEGDVLLVDNMSVAHGREAFTGDRKVVVGMAEPFGRTTN